MKGELGGEEGEGKRELTCEVRIKHCAGEGGSDCAASGGSVELVSLDEIELDREGVHHAQAHQDAKTDLRSPFHVEATEKEDGKGSADKIGNDREDCLCQPWHGILISKALTSLRDGDVHDLQVTQASRLHPDVPMGL